MTPSFDPNRSVATLTISELETFIKATINQTVPQQASRLIPSELDINAPFDNTAPSFLDIIESHLASVPEEVWQKIPTDASKNFDKYPDDAQF